MTGGVPLSVLMPRAPYYRCSVCDQSNAPQIVPERGQFADDRYGEDDHLYYFFCTVCLDDLVSIFPLTPRMLLRRQLTGKPLRECR